jgi:hypothetical protein
MRINYSDEEDYPGQFHLFQANCARSLCGKAGQAALRELEAALLALPTKRLIAGKLAEQGDVCAIGALALYKGDTEAALEQHDEEYMEDVGEAYGLPRLVAWKVVEANDVDNEDYSIRAPGPSEYQWPHYTPGYQLRIKTTPEERYDAVLKWVQALLSAGTPKAAA